VIEEIVGTDVGQSIKKMILGTTDVYHQLRIERDSEGNQVTFCAQVAKSSVQFRLSIPLMIAFRLGRPPSAVQTVRLGHGRRMRSSAVVVDDRHHQGIASSCGTDLFVSDRDIFRTAFAKPWHLGHPAGWEYYGFVVWPRTRPSAWKCGRELDLQCGWPCTLARDLQGAGDNFADRSRPTRDAPKPDVTNCR
jgi:hypothetical protein